MRRTLIHLPLATRHRYGLCVGGYQPLVLTRCAKRDPQVTELTGFLAHKRYSTTEFWSNVKQICCQIDESVTLYLIKFVTQLY